MVPGSSSRCNVKNSSTRNPKKPRYFQLHKKKRVRIPMLSRWFQILFFKCSPPDPWGNDSRNGGCTDLLLEFSPLSNNIGDTATATRFLRRFDRTDFGVGGVRRDEKESFSISSHYLRRYRLKRQNTLKIILKHTLRRYLDVQGLL